MDSKMSFKDENWFVVDFAQLQLDEREKILKFLEEWKVKNPEKIGYFIGYLKMLQENKRRALLEKKPERIGFENPRVQKAHYIYHQKLDSDGEIAHEVPFENYVLKGDINKDLKIILEEKEAVQELVNETLKYIEKFEKAQRIKKKYGKNDSNEDVLSFLDRKTDEYDQSVFSQEEPDENLEKELEWLQHEYWEYFIDGGTEFLKPYGETYYIKPLGALTEDFNKRISNIPFGFVSGVEHEWSNKKRENKGLKFQKAGFLIEDFVSILFYNLFEYINYSHGPIRCSYCQKFISNPSQHQITQVKKGQAVLHKKRKIESNEDAEENKQYYSGRERSNYSECELAYYRQKDKIRMRRKRKKA